MLQEQKDTNNYLLIISLFYLMIVIYQFVFLDNIYIFVVLIILINDRECIRISVFC